MQVYTCVCMYVCICVCVCMCMCVCIYVCMCVYVCMYVCVHVCMYVCVCVCMYVCMCVCRLLRRWLSRRWLLLPSYKRQSTNPLHIFHTSLIPLILPRHCTRPSTSGLLHVMCHLISSHVWADSSHTCFCCRWA